MLDARKIYHKVTQKVNDFSPEQHKNLISIVNLYRGKDKKFKDTVNGYLTESYDLAKEASAFQSDLFISINSIIKTFTDFAVDYAKDNTDAEKWIEQLKQTKEEANTVHDIHSQMIEAIAKADATQIKLEPVAELCKTLRKPQDKLIKQIFDLVASSTKEYQLNKIKEWKDLGIKDKLDNLKAIHLELSGNPDEEEPGLLHDIRYYWKESVWLTSRFPEGYYRDVEGLCKVVTREEIASKDYSLSPGRYVGVDTATDDDFDYEERLQEIHIELQGLNEEAVQLANTIAENYKGLGI
jgi:type I restriction enzyme M protein